MSDQSPSAKAAQRQQFEHWFLERFGHYANDESMADELAWVAWQAALSDSLRPLEALQSRVAELEHRAERAEAGQNVLKNLVNYAKHKPSCLAMRTDGTECDCGLADILLNWPRKALEPK